MSVGLQRRRFTVRDYYAMADAGILTEDDRVELIEGEIIEMAAIGSRHAACVDRLNRLFVQGTGERAVVRVQNPVRLSDLSEPQPDVTLLRPRKDFYAQAHPGPGDVLLIVEVAHSTLSYDRGIKLPLYARAGIPEVWIVDVEHRGVDVYHEPRDGQYFVTELRGSGDILRLWFMPSVAVAVDDILG
jgi:Uma2 family endonuclease